MRIKEVPDLEKGFILKRSMLLALSDAAILTNELLRKGYADGILSGCELSVTEDTIVLNSGLIFLEQQIFMMKNSLSVSYKPTNITTLLKLCISGELRDADCVYREAELRLEASDELRSGELEICRFKLQDGARLRCEYQDFEDRSTEYDTLNRIYTPCAALDEPTLLPEITKHFAREMLGYSDISELDTLFCLQILGQREAVTKEALVKYIEYKTKKQLDSHSNLRVYQELRYILQQQTGSVERGTVKEKKAWRMMIE